MRDKICISERRMKILEILAVNKQSTCSELADEFNVSSRTITRDIIYLSVIALISTKRGNQGGIYIAPDYKLGKEYLTETEEECLYELSKKVTNREKRILCDIIAKFARSAVLQ